jgi:hypothetical protein
MTCIRDRPVDVALSVLSSLSFDMLPVVVLFIVPLVLTVGTLSGVFIEGFGVDGFFMLSGLSVNEIISTLDGTSLCIVDGNIDCVWIVEVGALDGSNDGVVIVNDIAVGEIVVKLSSLSFSLIPSTRIAAYGDTDVSKVVLIAVVVTFSIVIVKPVGPL